MSKNRYTIKIACAELRRFLAEHSVSLEAVKFVRRRIDGNATVVALLSDGRQAAVVASS